MDTVPDEEVLNPWDLAEALYLLGDTELLEKMLASEKIIPSATRRFLAQIVGGGHPIKRTGRTRGALPYSARERISLALSPAGRLYPRADFGITENDRIANVWNSYMKMDAHDAGTVQAGRAALRARKVSALAVQYGVTESTIKQVPRRFAVLRSKALALIAERGQRQP